MRLEPRDCVIGLDIGTAGCRAVAFDQDLNPLAGESRSCTMVPVSFSRVTPSATDIAGRINTMDIRPGIILYCESRFSLNQTR